MGKAINLADLHPDDIEVVSTPQPQAAAGAIDLTQIDPQHVELVGVTKQKASLADAMTGGLANKAWGAVENAGGKVLGAVMDSPVGSAMKWVGDKAERYITSPFYAEVGALQNGASLSEAQQAGERQFGEERR